MCPQFPKVIEVILKQCILLSVELYTTVNFDSHYNSFVVKLMDTYSYPTYDQLSYYRPLHLRNSFDPTNKNLYLTLPCM